MPPMSTHKYEPLEFNNIIPLKHIYAMYFVWWKTPHDKIFCANTKLKISELMNINNLNYIYANVMQQFD